MAARDNDAYDDIELTDDMGFDLKPIAYVRPLTADEKEATPDNVHGAQAVALHDEDGRPLAMFPTREAAIAAAQVNDFTPVSVH